MSAENAPLQLLEMLAIPAGEPVDPRLARWAGAFEAWMAERQVNPKLAQSNRCAWREFLALVRKPPWQVGAAEVEAYVAELQARGLRPSTIAGYLSALSRFYAYCDRNGVDPLCQPGFNPLAGVRRPRVVPYEKARYLTRAEEELLLEQLRRDVSPLGKRDYAMVLALLRTGWKSVRVRRLRWRDVASLAAYGDVMAAILEQLHAAGRLESIQPGDYVFAPSREALLREAGNRAEDWVGDRPLSMEALRQLVNLHAGGAGLKAGKITCHTLRHTAAMRRLEDGVAPVAAGDFPGPKGASNLQHYLKQLKKKPKGYLKARGRVGLDARPVPSRGPQRLSRRHHKSLKHGLGAKYLPEFEYLAEKGLQLHGMDAVIFRWRVVIQRALVLGLEAGTLREAASYLNAMGAATVRLARAMKLRHELRQMAEKDPWLQELVGGADEEEE